MTIESNGDLACMRAVGCWSAARFEEMKNAVRPGNDDRPARRRRRGVSGSTARDPRRSSTYDFPGFNCISVNDEIVHGVPGPRRISAGDVVKIDVTAELDGLIADSAITVLVPPVSTARTESGSLRDAPRSIARCLAPPQTCGSPSWEGRSKTK